MPVEIGFLVFPDVQQLDLTGPYEVFSSWPEAKVRLVWKTRGALTSSTGLRLEPKKGPIEILVVDHCEKQPTDN